MDGLTQDLRLAWRGLRRDAGFTAFVLVTLALGIGANAVTFGIVDRLVLTGPMGVRDASTVVRVYWSADPPGQRHVTTAAFGNVAYDLFRTQASRVQGVAAYAVNQVLVGDGAETHAMSAGYASETLFPMLGVAPELGRFIDAEDNRPDAAAHVAVLGDSLWRTSYGGSRDAIGRAIRVGGTPYTIVGVARAGFTGPQFGPVDLWLPINLKGPQTAPDWKTTWHAQWLSIVARLSPDVTPAQASDELTAIYRRGYAGGPDRRFGSTDVVAHTRIVTGTLQANNAGVEAPDVSVVRWLAGVAIIVLLIACANVANLQIARGLQRGREIAVRTALGARAGRIVRLLLVESLMLSIGGAALGLIVAYWIGRVARTEIFSWVDWSTSPIDARVLIVSVVLGVATGLLVGVAPAWRATRTDLTTSLKTGARDGGGARQRLRQLLTVGQAALCALLLIGAGLFVRSLWHVRTLPMGFDPDRIAVVAAAWPSLGALPETSQDAERVRRRVASRDAVDAIRRLPGVEHASLAAGTPFGNRFEPDVRVPGPSGPTLLEHGPSVSAIGDDYFATAGTRILRGRAFGPTDREGSEPVAIVNETMAGVVWPTSDPIGQCVVIGKPTAPCARIVGIAENTHQSALREPPSMHLYMPFGQEVGFGGTAMLVRAIDPLSLGDALRHTVAGLDPTIRYVSVSTLQQAIDPLTKSWRVGASVFLASGGLALLVAAIGIYSVLSFLVADRRREIGVRVALGAQRADVTRLIVSGSLGLASAGVVLGTVAAVALSGQIAPLLFDESPRDPAVYLAVGGVILTMAVLAGLGPSARANRVDPVVALRD
jgi:predicted permease